MFDLKAFAIPSVLWIGALLACSPKVASASDPPLDELEQKAFQAAADYCQDSTVQVETFGGLEIVNQQLIAQGPSTGTILTSDGWVVTSIFQFRGQPASITVILPDEQRKAAKLVARDHSRELALLKIDTDKPLRAAVPSDRSKWKVGQWTIALGKTFDTKTASRSVGILSAQGRIWNKAIQTDAKISPQNYGGPLIDLEGKVMGIIAPLNPGIATEGEVEQWYDSGVGFAVPLADVLERLPQLQSGQDIHPGKAGFRTQNADEFAKEVVLSGVTPGSPVAKAGMKAGDRIVGAGLDRNSVRGVAMHSELRHIMGPIDAGKSMTLEVERQGKREFFDLSLVKELPTYHEPYLGVVLAPVSDSMTPPIALVLPNSPAATAGIEVGETIVGVDSSSIDEDSTLESLLAFVDYRDPISLKLKNQEGIERAVQVKLEIRPESDFEWNALKQGPPEGAAEPKGAKGTVQLPLGDVKNRAFAIVPSNYTDEVPHGLLLIYADAGVQDQKQWTDAWEVFARDHRWIIVVAQSADEKGWSREEMEIAIRLRSHVANLYHIDRRRTCIGGIASGSQLAVAVGLTGGDNYRGLWLSNAKIPARFRLPAAEPMKLLSLFINGADSNLGNFAKQSKAAGYSVAYYNEEFSVEKMMDAQVIGKLQRWLRLLEAY